MFNNDPSALFNQLVKEASNQQAASEDQGGSTKTASQNGAQMFDKQFFQKLASDDTEAAEALQEFVANAIEEGHSPEEVEQFIAEAESEAMEGEETQEKESEDGEFDEAQKVAEIMAVEKSIDDELAENELAKIANIDRETIEQFLIGEAQGQAYYHGRMKTAEIIEKIASQIIPSDEAIVSAIENLREAGFNISDIESQINEMSKQASVDTAESPAVAKARELADAEEKLFNSLSLMKTAGFDIDSIVKEAEEKKKMSGKKKALLAGAGLLAAAGGTAGGLGMLGKYKGVGGKFNIGEGAKVVKGGAGSAFNWAKNKVSKAPATP